MKGFLSKHLGLIVVIILGFLPLFPLLHSGLPVTHDGQDHVARIANFYASLADGNFIPRWANNLNWGYGHPILMFLYPLPSYIASLFHFFGFSLVDSVKLTFAATYVFSGVFMYIWMRNVTNEKAGIVAAVLYMYAPYRFVDLYVRGAIGEHVAFMCIPLVLYFLYKISLFTKNIHIYLVLLSVSTTALILSHNAVSIMVLPIALLYATCIIYFSKKRLLLSVYYVVFLGLGITLSSFFLLPAFFEGKYTLRDIVTGNSEYAMSFVKPFDYINLSWSFGGSAFLSKQIGLVQVFGVILSIVFIKRTKGILKLTSIVFLLILLGVLFIMLPYSNFIWQTVSILQKFQFPWRFLTLVVLVTAFLSAVPLVYIKSKRQSKWLAICFCAAAVILYFPYYSKVQGYLHKPEEFYTQVYESTTDTGESAPIWSVRFMEKSPGTFSEVIDGDAQIHRIFSNSTNKNYKIIVTSENARIRENTLYFPNWSVYVNGNKTDIEFQDPANRGLITYYLPQGTHEIDIKFENTKIRTVSSIISSVSLLMLLGYVLINTRRR